MLKRGLSQEKPLLLDGGMGRELRCRGVEILETIWSAAALITAPDVVRKIHQDYITSGADIITTNTYGIIRDELRKEGLEERFAELNIAACRLAREAADALGQETLVAGSLPPLRGSYRADLVGPIAEIGPLYEEQAELLAPFVDLILCETMSSAVEARAAAAAAVKTGKPVWVAWTLHEDCSGRLRSGETIAEAGKAITDLPVAGVLTNCCPPESITKSIPGMIDLGVSWVGGYANTFTPIPEDWTLDGQKESDGLLPMRDDLSPESYAVFVQEWLEAGANVVGGCCGTGPEHIAELRKLIDQS